MTAALKIASDRKGAPASGERRCLATGAMKPRAEMIRFVIGPDKSVVPDLAENLPGAGLWVTASSDAVTLAAKKNLFAKAAKTQAKPAEDLAAQVSVLLRARCLSLMGLAKGAGVAVLGESQTEAALRSGDIVFHLRAADAARVLDNRHAVPECALFSREELGAAFGYGQIVYAGLAPHGLTEKIEKEAIRLQRMTGRQEQ
ncbi:MAG: DUF448 domain-containing protein [Alphaproteobacteria bacterium]|nr:DUF448 domain-containing protein [Alphaproteobacteria bacterium]